MMSVCTTCRLLVGNGGGYGYGVMGGTHHALEDYGAMLCLRNMHVFVPGVWRRCRARRPPTLTSSIIRHICGWDLRKSQTISSCRPIPRGGDVCRADGPTLLVAGPLLAGCWHAFGSFRSHAAQPRIVSELPLGANVPTHSSRMPVAAAVCVWRNMWHRAESAKSLAHLLMKIGLLRAASHISSAWAMFPAPMARRSFTGGKASSIRRRCWPDCDNDRKRFQMSNLRG